MGDRVYLTFGTVAHELSWGVYANSGHAALCGRTPWPADWLGTGTQSEYERAAELPLCVQCDAVLRHQAGGVG